MDISLNKTRYFHHNSVYWHWCNVVVFVYVIVVLVVIAPAAVAVAAPCTLRTL